MDRVTGEVSKYIKSKGISIQAISNSTGISYNILHPSLSGNGKRKLRADEFLEICDFLSVNPKRFKNFKH